ncbi:P-loop containing nucleoside triphosphate hydrolase protein [Obelidium mucronatum]|nr:P-loop containing nucleoside triphosphate hydrolase protein [Obelidium mucronatum]
MVRAKAAEDEKRELFGSWTGKVPLSVLFEHAQRMEWDKPQVNTAKKGTKGFVASIVLSKLDPKTKSKAHITFTDPDYSRVYPTEVEAKQWAATYALHRIASHLSLHRLLPPSHQAFWAELETTRKAEPADIQKYEYAADPFAVDEMKAKDAKDKDRETKVELDRVAKETEKLSKPWEMYQKVQLSADMRTLIENLIRREDGDEGREAVSNGAPRVVELDVLERVQILEALVNKGFRQLHAEESLEYNSDLTSAINWLCIYVPEDDLPPAFHTKPSNAISHGQSTNESLNRKRAVEYMTQSGFNTKTCELEYDSQSASELKALASLASKLAESTETTASDSNLSELNQIWLDELEAVESIFGTDAIRHNPRNHMVEITLDMSNSGNDAMDRVELHIGRPEGSVYPHQLPALLIVSPSVPAYIRLSILRGLVREAKTRWIGGPMIFEMVQWIQEHFSDILENPGVSLMQLKRVASPPAVNIVKAVTKDGASASKAKESKKKPRIVETDEEIQMKGRELQQQYEEKIATAAYKTMLKMRQRLPSYKFRDQIIESVESNQVVIICGETGCGKSTQTGQFILEHLLATGRGGKCNMICTQPRRISAMALAERVASERAESVGESIGYSIRGENVRSAGTRLIFATTGIVLRMLQGDPLLSRVTHVIVDEVHERSVDSDFLLVILRDLLSRRPDFRLILMSATIDSETFSNYFHGAPVLNIPGFTHPVTDFYLEDVLRLTQYIPEPRRFRQQQQQQTAAATDSVDYSLVAATVKFICSRNASEDDGSGAILVFLQGAMEIKKCIDVIKEEVGAAFLLDVMPLHAQLSPKEQNSVFRRPKKGYRKVVVCTNVAETSITIDDVVYVIDAGRVKVDTLASRASCKQRRGRAGRVRPGTCYKLYSKNLEQTQMTAHAVPEILRVPLEQLCLSLKAMGIEDVKAFLGKAISAPAEVNIQDAVRVLRELHAVDKANEKLTPLGKHMAKVPADLRISKMLIAYDAWLEASKKGKRAELQFCEENFLSSTALLSISDLRKQYLDNLVEIGFVKSEEVKLAPLAGGSCNTHAKDSRIVKACLAAGLYPQIASIKHPDITYVETAHGAVEREPLPQEIEFSTETDGRIYLHPSSCLTETSKYEDLLLVYHSKIQTSKVYLRDGTMISPWPVLMFGGTLDVDHEGRTVGVDGFTKFHALPRIAVLVNGLRKQLDRVLREEDKRSGTGYFE